MHSKFHAPVLHQESNQNSPTININGQQQVSQTAANNHMTKGPRGDYGSLPPGHGVHYVSGLQSNIKAVAISSRGQNNFEMGLKNMDGIAGSFHDNLVNDMSSHQVINQENYKRDDGHKYGYHHDNVQHVSGSSNSLLPSATSSMYGEASTSAVNATSSSVITGKGLKSWNHRF